MQGADDSILMGCAKNMQFLTVVFLQHLALFCVYSDIVLSGRTVYIHGYRQHVNMSQCSTSAVQPVGTMSIRSLLIQCHLSTTAVWTVYGKYQATVCRSVSQNKFL